MIKYILFGGVRPGRIKPNDPHERRGPPTHFKPNAFWLILGAFFVYGMTPLLFIQSGFGIIPFESSEFYRLATTEQYYRVLLYDAVILLKTATLIDPTFIPPLPKPLGTGWQAFVSATLLLSLSGTFVPLAIGIKRIIHNCRIY